MPMQLAITSNYAASTGDPAPCLHRIAEAGFTRVLWAHHAWSDYIYTRPEIDHVQRCLRETGLALNDLHCPTGKDQAWGSPVEHVRLAGIELIMNRIEMAARLACDAIVMHTPMEPEEEADRPAFWDRKKRTMDALTPYASTHGVRLALENTLPGNFDTLEKFFALYGPDLMGLCYDSGHGNARVDWPGNGLDRLERLRDRVVDFHLHDNDGSDDSHMHLFAGTVDWPRLARIMPTTSYRKPVIPIEVGMKPGEDAGEEGFLRRVAEEGRKFAALVESAARS